jgi:hypothetical protein
MNSIKGDVLTQAYELIEADKLDDAKAVLKPVLETDKDNPDAWWLYAHAVRDSETARIALNNVMRLDSEYPGAAELLKSLEQQSPSDTALEFHKDPSFLPNVPESLPDLPESGEDFDDFDDEVEESEPIYRRPIFLIAVIALLVIIAIIFVVARPFGGTVPESTSVSTQPTAIPATDNAQLPPTVESQTDTTQIPPTVEVQAVNDPFAALRSMLSSFTLADNGIQISNTSLGNTLLVSVCTTQGLGLRSMLPQVLDALAKANATYVNQAEAIGVRMADCQTNANLLTIGVPISDAVSYANGSLSEEDFQAKWKPLV